MANATPYDLYIRFLITKGQCDLKEVNELIRPMGLKALTQDELDRVSELIERSVPPKILEAFGDPKKQVGADFLRWMSALEIKELWQGQKQFLDADIKKSLNLVFGILDDVQLSMTINALIIKNCPLKDIYEAVNAKFSCMVKEHHLLLYRKFFFDPRRMSRTAWKAYLRKTSSKERSIYFTALTEPLDVVKNELELPTRMAPSEPLQYLMVTCYRKAKQYLELTTKEANVEARAWISQFSSLVDKYERYKTGDKADFSKQLQMEFDFIDSEFPTPDAGVLEQIQRELEEKINESKDSGG